MIEDIRLPEDLASQWESVRSQERAWRRGCASRL